MIRPLLAATLLASACASPAHIEGPPRWRDAGTPPEAVAVLRVARYYVDDTGSAWDDRGPKVEAAP